MGALALALPQVDPCTQPQLSAEARFAQCTLRFLPRFCTPLLHKPRVSFQHTMQWAAKRFLAHFWQKEPPRVHAVLPTEGAVDYLLAGYSRNYFEVRCEEQHLPHQERPSLRNICLSSSVRPETSTLNPQPSTLNPQSSTLNLQPSTLNPQPSTFNPQP